MSDLTIHSPLADTLVAIAQRENRPVESVLASMVAQYQTQVGATVQRRNVVVPDVPPDVRDKTVYQAAVQATRSVLYHMAREYWAQVGDQAKLALTDEQLDEQFWLIDPDGVPRLKSEQDSLELPPDPLDAIAGMIDDAPADMSMTVRDTIAAHYEAKADDERSS